MSVLATCLALHYRPPTLPAEDISERIAAVHRLAQADMLATLRREAAAWVVVAAILTAAAAMLIASAVVGLGTALALLSALRWFGLAVAGLILAAAIFFRHLPDHRLVPDGPLQPHLGSGTLVTLGRGTLIAFLLGFLGLNPAERNLAWVPAVLYTAVAVLDLVDGRLARRDGMVTRLGEKLDLEYDALGNMAAFAVAVHSGRLPFAFVAVGSLRYVYAAALWLWARRRRNIQALPPSKARRVVASLQSGFLCGALSPIVAAPVATVAGVLMASALLASFTRDGLAAAGVLMPQSAAYQLAEKRFRDVAFVFLPIPLRFGLAAFVVSRAVQVPESGLGDGAWLRIGLILVAVMVALGAAARSAAFVLLIGIAALSVGGSEPARLWMVAGAALVVILGSGGGSIWEPEQGLFRV